MKKYCRYCGVKFTKYYNGEYNEDGDVEYDGETGKKIMGLACTNQGCTNGKDNNCVKKGGHFYSLFRMACKKCGHQKLML